MVRRLRTVTETRKKQDWSWFLADIADKYLHDEKIILIIDNLNYHVPGSLYETWLSAKVEALLDRFDFLYTSELGSWINMADIELRVLSS